MSDKIQIVPRLVLKGNGEQVESKIYTDYGVGDHMVSWHTEPTLGCKILKVTEKNDTGLFGEIVEEIFQLATQE